MVSMIPAPLVAVAFVYTITTGPEVTAPQASLSAQQKRAAMQPLVRSATKCIANRVAEDPRLTTGADLGDLIVDSMPSCVGPVRTMIDAYDRYYGTGSGDAFFMGPYLDILPRAVDEWIGKYPNRDMPPSGGHVSSWGRSSADYWLMISTTCIVSGSTNTTWLFAIVYR